jgi:CubicO group peptidase (beta-lactamase class C family)
MALAWKAGWVKSPQGFESPILRHARSHRDPERFYDWPVDERELTALLRLHASRHSVPGAVLGIFRDGTVTTACCGVADVRTGAPVTPATLFSAGSLTKSMVATVMTRLANDGRLSLEDSVSAHVPELRERDWAQRSTLRDLLANRSGLPLSVGLEFDFAGRKDADDGALSRLVADLGGGPRSRFWSYTNVGWCVLGRVIETATRAPWEVAMGSHFVGLGMTETLFATDTVDERRASGHDVTAGGPIPVEPLAARAYGPAGTSVLTTITDLLRFAAAHLEDPSLAAMRDKHADISIDGWLDSWCLGWAGFDWEGGRAWGWDGLVPGERSVLRIVPDHGAAVVLMTNGSTGRAMYRSLFADLMASSFGINVAPLRLDPPPGAAGDLSRFAGVYAWPDQRVEVSATGNCLLIKSEDGESEARPLDERTFLLDAADPDNPTMTFGAYDATGRPQVLYDMLWGLPRLDE